RSTAIASPRTPSGGNGTRRRRSWKGNFSRDSRSRTRTSSKPGSARSAHCGARRGSRRWSSPPRRSSPAATPRRRRAPPAAPPRPPLLGRSAELAAAAAAWERAKAARGQVVLVQGEPGEGKTRLIEEVVARARLDDATVAAARAVPADREREWSAVAGLVATGLGDAPGLASAPAPALASLGALDPDLGTRFQGSRGEPAMHIAQAFTAAVIAAAGERPLLLVVDDAQWLDALSLTLLPALARDTAAHRVLLLLGVARGWPDGERFDALRGRLGSDLEGAVIRLERL